MFLIWSYTTWVFHVFPHFHFLLNGVNALTLAKWGHSESGGVPNGMLRKHGVAGNSIFRISARQAVCLQPWPHFQWPDLSAMPKSSIYVRATLCLSEWRGNSCTGTYIEKFITIAAVEGPTCMTFQSCKNSTASSIMGLQSPLCQGHNESGIPYGTLRKQDMAGNFIFGICARPAVCFATACT